MSGYDEDEIVARIGDGAEILAQELATVKNKPIEFMSVMYRANLILRNFGFCGELPPFPSDYEKLEKTKTGSALIRVMEHEGEEGFYKYFVGRSNERLFDNVRHKIWRTELANFSIKSLLFAYSKGWRPS